MTPEDPPDKRDRQPIGLLDLVSLVILAVVAFAGTAAACAIWQQRTQRQTPWPVGHPLETGAGVAAVVLIGGSAYLLVRWLMDKRR